MRKVAVAIVLLSLGAMSGQRAGAQSEQAGNAIAIAPPATLTTLVSFHDGYGENPDLETLVQGKDGNLYGTTADGGANSLGTVFKVTPTGKLIVLHSFTGADGKYPESGLLLGVDGNFYGMTNQGGSNNDGTIFKITRVGALTTLDEFDGTDGAQPTGALIQATDGNFYGTTSFGGNGNGTIFKVTPGGTVTTLHQFDGTDGTLPSDTLVQGSDGNVYGTATGGGTNFLRGTVFKMTPTGTLTTLYDFCAQINCADGSTPYAGLVQATDGNFYGTTAEGGAYGGGTVFKITLGGTLTTLYSFCSQINCADGSFPEAGLIQATDGNLYGTTFSGPSYGHGTIFNITPAGELSTLYTFCSQSGCLDGEYLTAGLFQSTSGIFYGATNSGGTHAQGTIFGLSLGLSPYAELSPTFGKPGATITILGTNLTGVTSVSFNGTPATFKVPTSSYLTATVPAGATTGFVQIITSSGTLQSNVAFRVAP